MNTSQTILKSWYSYHLKLKICPLFTIKLKQLKGELSQVDADIEKETQRLKSIDVGCLSDCDLTTKAGRIEAQLIIKSAVKEVVLNTAKRRCKVTFHNGKSIDLTYNRKPLRGRYRGYTVAF